MRVKVAEEVHGEVILRSPSALGEGGEYAYSDSYVLSSLLFFLSFL